MPPSSTAAVVTVASAAAAPTKASSVPTTCLSYSKWDAIGDESDDESASQTVAETKVLHKVDADGISQLELDYLRQLLIKYLEPLRAPPPASAPKVRLACHLPPQHGWVRVHEEPPIYTCDDFLSAADCSALIDAACADPRQLRPSLLGSSDATARMQTEAARRRNAVRTSASCTLQPSLPACARLRAAILAITGKTQQHLEPVSVSRYTEGQQYTEHQDASRLTPLPGGCPNPDDMEFMAQGGQRVATILVYLNDVPHGGATAFPTIGIEISPKAGRCLLFFPALTDGRCDEQTLHAARPAVDEKWVAQVWVRQHVDPVQLAMKPPRWPPGCATHADLLKLAFR